MIHYFFGLAANPFTKAHQRIIERILEEDPLNKLYVAITDHAYKEVDLMLPFDLRQSIVEANLSDYIRDGRVVLMRQTKRTYEFLSETWDMMDYIVVGEDEWESLKAGEWMYSAELMHTYKFKVIARNDDVSSSEVRKLLKNGAAFDKLEHYITKKTYDLLISFYCIER